MELSKKRHLGTSEWLDREISRSSRILKKNQSLEITIDNGSETIFFINISNVTSMYLVATRKCTAKYCETFPGSNWMVARIRAGRTEKLRFYDVPHPRSINRDVTNDARNEIVCSPNLRHLSRSVILLLSSVPVCSSLAKELIRINRCFPYALCSLSHCQERSFSWLIMIRWAASHRLHANFVIRHVYNQLIINQVFFFFPGCRDQVNDLPNPLFIPVLLIKIHPNRKTWFEKCYNEWKILD